MMITYHPDGGDLGRATIKPITALEMQIIIPHIANILDELATMKISELPFCYAFELPLREKDAAMFVIRTSSHNLPPRVFWFETDDKILFEIRGASGGIATSHICYLVTK